MFAVAIESVPPTGAIGLTPGRRRQAPIDAVEQRMVCSVARVVPEHDSTQMMFEDILAFCGDGFRILIGDECAGGRVI